MEYQAAHVLHYTLTPAAPRCILCLNCHASVTRSICWQFNNLQQTYRWKTSGRLHNPKLAITVKLYTSALFHNICTYTNINFLTWSSEFLKAREWVRQLNLVATISLHSLLDREKRHITRRFTWSKYSTHLWYRYLCQSNKYINTCISWTDPIHWHSLNICYRLPDCNPLLSIDI